MKSDENDLFLKISVTDTGCGIKLSDRKNVFKLFDYNNDSNKSNRKGVGLGLVISK